MSKNILIDTNIIIAHDRQDSDLYIKLLKFKKNNSSKLYLSPLVEYEYLYGIKQNKKSQQIALNRLKQLEPVALNTTHIKLAIKIVKKYPIGKFDSMIAATCILNNLELATLNDKHFKMINKLKIWAEK